ncbi:MAG: thioredoxin domain-containing protein, partial [Pseudomonadota bacterium]
MPLSTRSYFALGAIAAVGGLAAANLAGFGQGNANASEKLDKKAVEEIVREYLLENPEVIFQAVERYTERKEAQTLAAMESEAKANLPTLLDGGLGHSVGASIDDAELVIVEFFDYNCGACRQATDFVFELLEKEEGVRLTFLELPVVYEQSYEVALASLSLAGTEDFLPFHQALMSADNVVDISQIDMIAKSAGVDSKAIMATISNEKSRASLEESLSLSMQIAQAIGINGTPGFIVASPDGEVVKVVPGFNP